MKRIGIMLLQLLVTAAGLWYVFHDLQRRSQIVEALPHASLSWVLLGWIGYSVVEELRRCAGKFFCASKASVSGWLRAGAIVIIGLFPSGYRPRETKTRVSTSQN